METILENHKQRKGSSCPSPEIQRSNQGSNPFLMSVPDYVLADWDQSKPKFRSPSRGRASFSRGLNWPIHQAVLQQKTRDVILADVVLAQIIWGGDKSQWPRNWRNRIVKRLKENIQYPQTGLAKVVHREVDTAQHECPDKCPLYGTSVRHHHLEITINSLNQVEKDLVYDPSGPGFYYAFLGALDIFREYSRTDQDFDWTPPITLPEHEDDQLFPEGKEAHEKRLKYIKKLKNQGVLSAVYFPPYLFGISRLVGLNHKQKNILLAMTHELTRHKRTTRSERPDKAEIWIGGQPSKSNKSFAIALCPFLDEGERYVGFNGNGRGKRRHLRGRGYKWVESRPTENSQ